MRILIISDRYPPHSLGGYETAAAGAAQALRRTGHQVLVLTSVFGVHRPERDDSAWRVLHRPMDTPSLLTQALWELQDLATVRRCLREFAPDAIYAFNLVQLFPSLHQVLAETGCEVAYEFADSVSLLTHLRLAGERETVWSRPGGGLRGHLRRGVRRVSHAVDGSWGAVPTPETVRLDRAIFCSASVLDRCRAAGLPIRGAAVIYNPVDMREFATPRTSRGDSLRVLFVGRLVQEKGAAETLEACRMLVNRGRKVQLSIAGPAVYPVEYSEALRHAASAPGVLGHVTFLGNVPHSEMSAVYSGHDVLVFPSSAAEGMPMTLLEAMAAGLPIISTLTGGTAEILEPDRSCLTLSLPVQPAEIASQIERIASDTGLASRLAAEARRFVASHCSPEDIARRTVEFLRDGTKAGAGTKDPAPAHS